VKQNSDTHNLDRREGEKAINEEVHEDDIARRSIGVGHRILGITMSGNQLGVNIMEHVSPDFSDICVNISGTCLMASENKTTYDAHSSELSTSEYLRGLTVLDEKLDHHTIGIQYQTHELVE
jgi:hypothetical protein